MDKKELNNFVYSIFDFVLEDLSEKNLNILEMDIDVYTVIEIYCEKNKLKIDKFKEEELEEIEFKFFQILSIIHMSHGMAWSNEVETSREIIDISMYDSNYE
tara:strand:- start:680 stop:985 length:306 start_codon:yes stop_codon:yes gene_type:complete